MKNTQLNRVIQFMNRNQEKAIVMDPETSAIMVLLPFDTYEELVDGGSQPDAPIDDLDDSDAMPWENDGLDKISVDDFPDTLYQPPKASESTELNPPVAVTPEETRDTKNGLNFSENWVNPSSLNDSEEVSLADVPEEEERFYLEPIE